MGIEITLGSRSFRGLSVKELNYFLSQAVEIGISKIDCAPTYGDTEKLIGRAIAMSSMQEKFRISPKIMRSSNECTHKKPFKSIYKSLTNLKLDQLDIVYFHGTDLKFIKEETFVDLFKLVSNGDFQSLGYSGDNQNLEFALFEKRLTHFLITLNIVDQKNLKNISDKNVFIAKRILANHFWRIPGDTKKLNRKEVYRYEIAEKVQVYRERNSALKLSKVFKSNDDMTEKFLRFASFTPGINGIVIGTSKFQNLQFCLESLKKGPLSPEEYLFYKQNWISNSGKDWQSIS